MRWKLATGVGVLVVAAVVGLAMTRAEQAPPEVTPPTQARPGRLAPAPPAPIPTTLGSISGRVLRRGAGVPGARVVARDESTATETRSGSGGQFELRGLQPGRYWLSAALEDEASPLVGPVLLGPGETRGDHVLELLAAGTVRGTVYDAATRATVAGALVRSSGGSAVTDRAGRFSLRGLAVGETWLEAVAKGYAQRTEWLTLDAARELGGMEIFLRRAGTLSGRVTRMGQAVAGARVWAEAAGLSPGAKSYGPGVSAADGSYQLSVEAGALRLAAAAMDGARVAGPTATLGEGESREGLDVELGEGLEAGGIVRVQGAPVDGATVWLLDGKTQRLAASAVTQAGGRFAIGGLAAGSYLVQVQRGAVVAQRGPFALEQSGADWTVDVDGVRTLGGVVEPHKAGVAVRWRSTDWAGPLAAETLTDAAGRFGFEAVPEGTLWVEAEDAAGSARVQATAGTAVVLKLVPAFVRGIVRDDLGHAVTDFTVRLLPVGGGPLRSYPTLSPTGDFQIQASPGTYEVSAVALGYGETADNPRVELQGAEAFVKLALQPSAEASGRVVDAQTRAPIAGAEVVVFRSPFGAGRWATLVTGSDGAFHLSAAPRSGTLQVRKAGYGPLWAPLERLPRGADGSGFEVALTSGKDEPPQPYEGVGLQLDFRGAVRVASVFEGGPAEAAGVMAGDLILSADGQPLAGLSGQDVVARIMGPSGTVVRLSLQRADQTLEVYIRRRSIQF